MENIFNLFGTHYTAPAIPSQIFPNGISQSARPLLMCAICDCLFYEVALWRTHTRDHFSNDRTIFPCRLCHTQFPDTYQLQLHMSSHSTTRGTQTSDADMRTDIKSESSGEGSMDYSHFADFVAAPEDEAKFDMVLVTEVKVEDQPQTLLQDQIKKLGEACVMIQQLDDSVLKKYVKQEKANTEDLVVVRTQRKIAFDWPDNSSNCGICNGVVVNLFPSLAEAIEEHQRNQDIECRLCGNSIRTTAAFKKHYQSAHLDRDNKLNSTLACDTCIAKRLRPYLGKDVSYATRPFGCDQCSKRFKTQADFRYHRRHDHTDRCVFLCTKCPRPVIGHIRFKKHMYIHKNYQSAAEVNATSTNRFECAHCPKVFLSRNSILAHLKTHFPGERFACPLCPMTLKTAGNLKAHIWHHEGRKNVTCHICGRTFLRKENFAFHMRSHTGEQPFECTVCGKRFSGKANRNQHMLIHTGEKPYPCDKCDKRYRDYSDLRRHKRVHGGVEKKHKCEICDKSYFEGKFLRAHRLSAHKMAEVGSKI